MLTRLEWKEFQKSEKMNEIFGATPVWKTAELEISWFWTWLCKRTDDGETWLESMERSQRLQVSFDITEVWNDLENPWFLVLDVSIRPKTPSKSRRVTAVNYLLHLDFASSILSRISCRILLSYVRKKLKINIKPLSEISHSLNRSNISALMTFILLNAIIIVFPSSMKWSPALVPKALMGAVVNPWMSSRFPGYLKSSPRS